jgi:lipid-binding SYLF domain-containing protein
MRPALPAHADFTPPLFLSQENDMQPMTNFNKGLFAAMLILGIGVSAPSQAFDASTLNAEVAATKATFKKDQPGAEAILDSAKGVLTCPKIIKGGFVIGASGGKCALEVGGKIVDYYGYTAVKYGFLAGISSYAMIMVFNDEAALGKFRSNKREWEAGVDANVAVASVGAGGTLDTNNIKGPVVAFVFGEKGLMADASLKGGRFKRLDK